ncbi:MAG TPA: L-histidine N(alpha)-methyltransferase [Sphingobacteriaceae bacterium]|nr:L-histidine N(alpha)-methyltransferase [Sphingobacteriaceae bacterium]
MMNNFLNDVLEGLSSEPKKLQSKYLYDEQGGILFQKIMHSEEYYLTDCELEIFKTRCLEIRDIVSGFKDGFDLIELGAGDAFKSSWLIKCFLDNNLDITYYPIDISDHVIELLENKLPSKFPELKLTGLNGEYFQMLEHATQLSDRPKLVLLLGANIGNMTPDEAQNFCTALCSHMKKGDLVLIGFDLIKNPWIIFNAYNDRRGITKEFNLNLLTRINRELNATFDTEQFEHFENYDPETGACKSYLISLQQQSVTINGHTLLFAENECIYMETSHKYSIKEINSLAEKTGFKPVISLYDSKKWFTDVIWERV